MMVSGVTLPLEYHFEPGHPADGVTATIPLAALNQMAAERFEWVVPGLLREKITALIKTLPKQVRVNFVPAPDVAEAAFATLKPGDGSLYDALASFLTRMKNVPVHRQDFDPGALMDHLLMNFKVVDDSGRQVAGGRDLNAIKKQLGVAARETFAAMPAGEYHKDGIKAWDFGDLPESVEVGRHGMTLRGYPALVDNGPGEAVSLRLLDSLDAANASHRAGVRRLFMLQVREDLAYLRRNIPGIDQLCLWYATLGNCDDLKGDLLAAAADRAFYDDEPLEAALPRTHAHYVAEAQGAWRRLLPVGQELSALAKEALANYHELAKGLAGEFARALDPAAADMREQLAMLVPKNFLTATPYVWLRHVPRFLKAMQVRLRKLTNAGLSRDTAAAAVVTPFAQNYRRRVAKHRKEGVVDPQLEQFRWMLEELRVSLFAQELKTSMPISPQRLEKQWSVVKP
jgi:ATP-dependent helicase HrpA